MNLNQSGVKHNIKLEVSEAFLERNSVIAENIFLACIRALRCDNTSEYCARTRVPEWSLLP